MPGYAINSKLINNGLYDAYYWAIDTAWRAANLYGSFRILRFLWLYFLDA